MKWWMIALLVLWLVILGDGAAAFFAGMKCFQRRKRAPLALAMALVMFALALESLNHVMDQAIHAKNINMPIAYIVQQGIGRALKGIATWYLAWQLMKD